MASRTPEGPPPPPAVQRLRLRYARRERLRFSSHRDFQRALERALRRAEVPMAYSAGFSPHPKVSYAGAAPTGSASEAEYVEIAVTARCDPERLRSALDAALPPGLDVLEVVEVPLHGAAPLADLLEAGVWEVALPGVGEADARRAVDALLATGSAEVERVTTKGRRVLDVRPAVLRLDVVDPAAAVSTTGRALAASSAAGGEPCAILHLVVRHAAPAVRPDDVLTALRGVSDLAPPEAPRATRLAQGPLLEGAAAVADPLAAERGAVGV